jgi:hypothetical protein
VQHLAGVGQSLFLQRRTGALLHARCAGVAHDFRHHGQGLVVIAHIFEQGVDGKHRLFRRGWNGF